jgi:DNA-directed RNA polymerase subunit RPC12/RpoP
MKPVIFRLFTDTAGALLLALAVAMFISNRANAAFTLPHDPLLMISMRNTFWIIASIELFVGLICIFGKQLRFKAVLLSWLSLNLCVYQIGFLWSGNHLDLGAYWGSLANTFGVNPNTAYLIQKLVPLYLLIGSLLVLLWLWREGAKGYIKMACAHCGGHITFSPQNLSQRISCPHCQTAVTLLKPDETLKMSCVLCGGRVEFPAHALGQKIACPHCAKAITLLNPI